MPPDYSGMVSSRARRGRGYIPQSVAHYIQLTRRIHDRRKVHRHSWFFFCLQISNHTWWSEFMKDAPKLRVPTSPDTPRNGLLVARTGFLWSTSFLADTWALKTLQTQRFIKSATITHRLYSASPKPVPSRPECGCIWSKPFLRYQFSFPAW